MSDKIFKNKGVRSTRELSDMSNQGYRSGPLFTHFFILSDSNNFKTIKMDIEIPYNKNNETISEFDTVSLR